MPHPRRASIKKSSALLWKICALFTCWLGGAYYFVSRSQSRTRIRSSSNRLPVSEDVAKLKNGQPLLRRHDDENGYFNTTDDHIIKSRRSLTEVLDKDQGNHSEETIRESGIHIYTKTIHSGQEQGTNISLKGPGGGRKESLLLHSAFEARLAAFPECLPKMRYYCEQMGVTLEAGNIATLDSIQSIVAREEGAFCPATAAFSYGRTWKHWREVTILKERNIAISNVKYLQRITRSAVNGFPLGQSIDKMICIIVLTYPRPNEEAFLNQTLWKLHVSVLANAKEGYDIRILVMNSGGTQKPHTIFDAQRKNFEGKDRKEQKQNIISFFDNPVLSSKPPLKLPLNAATNVVSQQIVNQSWHIATALAVGHAVLSSYGAPTRKSYVWVLEDDMLLCPEALPTALQDLSDAEAADSNFRTLLTSYGFNGVFVPKGRIFGDNGFLLFLLSNQSPPGCGCVAPADISLYEWAGFHHYPPYLFDTSTLSKDGTPFTRATNLFEHLGSRSSTFSNRSFQDEQYKCGGPLQFSWDNGNEAVVLNKNQISAKNFRSFTLNTTDSHKGSVMSTKYGRVDVVTMPRRLRGASKNHFGVLPNVEVIRLMEHKHRHSSAS